LVVGSSNLLLNVGMAQAANTLLLNGSIYGATSGGGGAAADVTLSWPVGNGFSYASGTQITIRAKTSAGVLIGGAPTSCTVGSTSAILGAPVLLSTTTGIATFTFTAATTTTAVGTSSACIRMPALAVGIYTISYVSPVAGDIGAGMYYSGTSGSRGNQVSISASIEPSISMFLTSNVCNLGALSMNAVNTCSYGLVLSTNVSGGGGAAVTTQVAANNPLTSGGNVIPDAAGSVVAGTSGNGITIATSSATTTIVSPYGPTNPYGASTTAADLITVVAPIQNATTTITHQASVNASVPYGSYTQTLTYTTTASF
jgi:hypothetical protein